jgi:hypothetical protein
MDSLLIVCKDKEGQVYIAAERFNYEKEEDPTGRDLDLEHRHHSGER